MAFSFTDPKFLDFAGDSLQDLGYGLATGSSIGNAFGAATKRSAEMDPIRQANAEKKSQKNATVAYFKSKGYTDLVARADAGEPLANLYTEAVARSNPKYEQVGDNLLSIQNGKVSTAWSAPPKPGDPFTLGPGDTRFGPDGTPLAQGQPASKTETVPAGYRANPDGTYSFIPGGPADPSTAGKTTEATRRNQQLATVIEPEVQSLMGDGKNPGTFDALANGWDQARDAGGGLAMGVGQGPSPAFQQAKNSLKTIIASYLYSVSGATANPGEVETQASVLTPKFGESPAAVADKKRRIQVMVDAVRAAATGTPIDIGSPNTPAQTGGSGDPDLDRALQQYGQ
jgi:hypothetical protein